MFDHGTMGSDMVPFFDFESGRLVRIPARELRPGVVQARIEGIDELVWVLPEQLKPGELKHPPFSPEVRAVIEQIQHAFAEPRPLSLEEWEDGFRRDTNPGSEIALWSHAADVYTVFALHEPDARRRADVFRIVVACLTASQESVWHVLETEVMTRPEAERIVARFHGNAE
jgi:hypothetical protein